MLPRPLLWERNLGPEVQKELRETVKLTPATSPLSVFYLGRVIYTPSKCIISIDSTSLAPMALSPPPRVVRWDMLEFWYSNEQCVQILTDTNTCARPHSDHFEQSGPVFVSDLRLLRLPNHAWIWLRSYSLSVPAWTRGRSDQCL